MIQRTIYEKILKSIETKPVTLITGARQVGKTTICKMLVKEKGYNYVSLDNSRELSSAVNDPAMFLKMHPAPLIIDEVQKCKDLFVEIESIVNEARFNDIENRGMYVLTGSQTYNLMENVSETMSGRVTIVLMSPLSLREIRGLKEEPFLIDPIRNNKDTLNNPISVNELYDYIVRGFYPEIYDKNIEDIDQFYSDYVMTYIERDVSQIIELRDKLRFQRFMEILASQTGEELTYDEIAKGIGVKTDTIQSWVSILAAGSIITLLEPYYENSVMSRVVKRPKIIFNDTGLAAYLSGLNNPTVLQKSKFNGRFVETYIINEIIKSFRNTGKKAKFYYYRDYDQKEIDLVVLHEGKLNLIECKSGVSFKGSDVSSFKKLESTNFELSNSGIVCNTDISYSLTDKYYAVPLASI